MQATKYLIQFDQGFLTFSNNLTPSLGDALLYSHWNSANKALEKYSRRQLGTNPKIKPVQVTLEEE